MVHRMVSFVLALILLCVFPLQSRAAGLSDSQINEVETAYLSLINDFYKPVNAQRAIDAARAHVMATLVLHRVVAPIVPRLAPSDNAVDTSVQLAHLVGVVAHRYRALPKAMIVHATIAGLLESVSDKYTYLLSAKEYKELNSSLDGGERFGGIGITIGLDERARLMVQAVLDGTPAYAARLQSGDLIQMVDGKSTGKLSLDQDARLIRGKVGSLARLTLLRDGKTIHIAVKRALIQTPSVISKMLPGKVGYVRLFVFGWDTADDMRQAIKALDAAGARAFVLDLRDNGGGYLNSAIDVSSSFIDEGNVVSVVGRDKSDVSAYPPMLSGDIEKRKLVVLVNGYTASASEITAGALQDDHRATILGTKTYGKGVVQTIYPLDDGAAVKITTKRYLTPAGHDINGKGIQPDVAVVENAHAQYGEPARDRQLQAALRLLKRR